MKTIQIDVECPQGCAIPSVVALHKHIYRDMNAGRQAGGHTRTHMLSHTHKGEEGMDRERD